MSDEIASGSDSTDASGGSWAEHLAGFLLLACVLVVAFVPDEAIIRTKMVWSRATLLSAGSLLLLVQGLRGKLRFHWATWLAAALVPGLLGLLHPVHTEVASSSLARDEVQRLLLIPATAWIAATILAHRPWRTRLVLVLALSGLYIGGYALLQRLGGLIPAASFAALGIDPAARAHAGFGNPVFLGAWLVLVTPVLIAEALTGPSRTRWLAGLAAGLCLPALLATESAGSWFGFGIAAVLGLWLLLPTRLRVLMGVILALAAASLAIGGFDTLARERVHTLIWRDSWELFSAHPGGVGPGQFQVAFLPYASPELLEIHPRSAVIINDAHSEPLQLLVELGWPALLAVLVAVLCGFQAARQRLAEPFEDRHQRALFVAALAAVGGSVGQSFVSPDLRFHVTVLMLGVLIGFLASQSQALVAPLGWGKPGRALVALLALAGLTFTGLQTWDRIQFAEKIRPPAPADTSPDTIQRIDTLQAAVEAAPDDPLRLYELGSALFEARRHAEAAEAFRNALALDPHNPIIARSLGITQSLSGQYDQAVVHLRMSLKAKPDDPDIRYLVAFSAFGRGDLLTALTEVEELLADYPDHERAAVLLERLRE